jgi:predicted small secreted protein
MTINAINTWGWGAGKDILLQVAGHDISLTATEARQVIVALMPIVITIEEIEQLCEDHDKYLEEHNGQEEIQETP